jgi:hypothetical protein
MKPTDLPEQGTLSPVLAPPLPPPPRVVRRRRGHGWLLGHVPRLVWLLGLAGVSLLLPALWLVSSSLVLTLFGSTVPGKITGKSVPSSRSETTCQVQYTYYVGEQEYAAEETIDESAAARVYVGTAVKVRVLRRWPSYARLSEPVRRSWGPRGRLLFLAVLCNGALGLALWAWLRRPLRQRRLVHDGLAVTGWVVRKDVNVARPTSWHVQYAYQAPRHGLKREAAGDGGGAATKEWQVVMTVRHRDFDAVDMGAAVTVLYDPRRPFRSVIYAFADYEVLASERRGVSPPG